MKNNLIFWVGYSDLMTSLFFIMLVLFALTVGYLQFLRGIIEDEIRVYKDEKKEIENIQTALKSLDSRYFAFDNENFRYRMMVDLNFASNSDDIYHNNISHEVRKQLVEAGRLLFNKIDSLINHNSEVFYFLIIEGNTQRSNQNWIEIPDEGYRLSYRRALALFNFWKANGMDFRKLAPNCEIILAGSGYFGLSREENEELNRRFTIQITSKWKLEN